MVVAYNSSRVDMDFDFLGPTVTRSAGLFFGATATPQRNVSWP
jgi:hypothetical protein